MRIYNVCGMMDERVWDLICDIIFLDPVMTCHFSQFQVMWPHCRNRSSPFREWWAAVCSYIGQIFDTTHNEMYNWRWDNSRAFEDLADRSNVQTTSSGKVKFTG